MDASMTAFNPSQTALLVDSASRSVRTWSTSAKTDLNSEANKIRARELSRWVSRVKIHHNLLQNSLFKVRFNGMRNKKKAENWEWLGTPHMSRLANNALLGGGDRVRI